MLTVNAVDCSIYHQNCLFCYRCYQRTTAYFSLGSQGVLLLKKKKQNLFSLLSFLSLCIFPFSCLLSLFLFSLSWNVRGGDNRCLTKFTLQINNQSFTHTNTLESNFLNPTKYLCSLSLLEEQHLTRHFTNCEGRFFMSQGPKRLMQRLHLVILTQQA